MRRGKGAVQSKNRSTADYNHNANQSLKPDIPGDWGAYSGWIPSTKVFSPSEKPGTHFGGPAPLGDWNDRRRPRLSETVSAPSASNQVIFVTFGASVFDIRCSGAKPVCICPNHFPFRGFWRPIDNSAIR